MRRLTGQTLVTWALGVGVVSLSSFAAATGQDVPSALSHSAGLASNTRVLGGADRDELTMPVSPLSPFGKCTLQLFAPPMCWEGVILGRMAYPREAPWQAQIFGTTRSAQYSAATLRAYPLWELNHQCGGALIASDWIVTAAHCVVDPRFNASSSKVRLGALDISVEDGSSFSIARTIVHRGYNPQTRLNDIALVQIKRADNFRRDRAGNVMIIQLHGATSAGPPLLPWHTFNVAGWGVTTTGVEGRASPLLKVLEVARVPNDLCAQALRGGATRIDASVVCAAAAQGDACQGDSGGPLTLGLNDFRGSEIPVLVGIVSWGRGCAISGNPGVYTRISAHLDWIRRAMASDKSVVSLP